MTTFVYMNGHLTDIIVSTPTRAPAVAAASSWKRSLSRALRPLPPRPPRPPRAPRPPSAGLHPPAHYLHPLLNRRHHVLRRSHAKRIRRKAQFLQKYQESLRRHGGPGAEDLPIPIPGVCSAGAAVRRTTKQERLRSADREDGLVLGLVPGQGPGLALSDLERIQAMFPQENLLLFDKDPLAMKTKVGGMKRSSTAARLSRALSTKALHRPGPPEGSPPSGTSPTIGPPLAISTPGPPAPVLTVSPAQGMVLGQGQGQDAARGQGQQRQFLLEAPAHFTTGVQGQDRHLFLFTDLLLVAKARAGGNNYKLKEKVRVSELWLSAAPRAISDVAEVEKSKDTSFVLGWPTTNVVATFSTQATRDLWWNKLSEVLVAETLKEPKSTNIQVIYYDAESNIEYCKTFCVGPNDTVRHCIQLSLEHLEMRGHDPSDFQLWAKTARDDVSYPLVGHERPFAIKLSCLREGLSAEEGFDLDHCNNLHDPLGSAARCQFILRVKRKASASSLSESKKSGKKTRKSPKGIRQMFGRSLTRSEDSVDSPVASPNPASPTSPSPGGLLFGVPLATLGEATGDRAGERVPPVVLTMLSHVFAHGIHVQGIFRRSANQRMVKDVKRRLDSGQDCSEFFENGCNVMVTTGVLKEFLRSLPDSLLGSNLVDQWLEASATTDPQDKLCRVRSVLEQLPHCNLTLLAHLLCLLHHVARNRCTNLMSAANLGVCLAPSLLRATCHPLSDRLDPLLAVQTPAIVEYLITHCRALVGPHVTLLLGDPPQDSGAEESDSLHSGGMDSLELLDPCPPPRKDKMSLSRDSGLTMSDSQLYTPDEEESGSTSSSGSGHGSGRGSGTGSGSGHGSGRGSGTGSSSGRAIRGCSYRPSPLAGPQAPQPAHHDPHAKVSASISMPVSGPREYVRVYGGWEERVQECRGQNYYANSRTAQLPSATSTNTSAFKRQDWFRQPSALRRLASGNGSGCTPGLSSASASDPTRQAATSASTRNNNFRHDRLRRSASEESLLNSDGRGRSRPNLVGGGERVSGSGGPNAAPQPPTRHGLHSLYGYTMARSKSAHHLAMTPSSPFSRAQAQAPTSCGRLRTCPSAEDSHATSMDDSLDSTYSVPKALDATGVSGKSPEESYDSSTLSDDDSTPHVSRSNSRSKEAWESTYGNIGSPLTQPSTQSYSLRSSRANPDPDCGSGDTAAPREAVPPLPPKLRHLPPVHVELEGTMERRGRSRRRVPKTAQRSKSLPPAPPAAETPTIEATTSTQPPPYRPPPCVVPSHRAPITTYYLGPRPQHYLDQEESYV